MVGRARRRNAAPGGAARQCDGKGQGNRPVGQMHGAVLLDALVEVASPCDSVETMAAAVTHVLRWSPAVRRFVGIRASLRCPAFTASCTGCVRTRPESTARTACVLLPNRLDPAASDQGSAHGNSDASGTFGRRRRAHLGRTRCSRLWAVGRPDAFPGRGWRCSRLLAWSGCSGGGGCLRNIPVAGGAGDNAGQRHWHRRCHAGQGFVFRSGTSGVIFVCAGPILRTLTALMHRSVTRCRSVAPNVGDAVRRPVLAPTLPIEQAAAERNASWLSAGLSWPPTASPTFGCHRSGNAWTERVHRRVRVREESVCANENDAGSASETNP